ncbi:transcriptional regulator, MarR family [Desulfatibacillum aliphaticivorans]|uniref:Transcriptional regulator, MarR family n=1 Tax=Desulfatibacillum aliphaticivorans TaxID=218208 RepID=B8FCE5_DESAL|nr:MarR family transcriptional regulator [Desulfatibacillum aliphaticivorans]ACL05563.1 transcriptional regulator, MarR family [Desulfatibacillum aliphaticivorans]
MGDSKTILNDCLYFTANALARVITRMAEEEFRKTGLSPSHAFLMMLVNDNPGIGQKELCEHLQLAPSTVTRFVDAMANKGFLSRQSEGKASRVFPTPTGEDLHQPIMDAWKGLHERYSRVLGRKEGDGLTVMIDAAYDKLNKAG